MVTELYLSEKYQGTTTRTEYARQMGELYLSEKYQGTARIFVEYSISFNFYFLP